MLLGDSVDVVIVASPPHFHVEQAVAAMNRGKPVFLEKPPAMSEPDLSRLLEAAQGNTLTCDYVFCHNPLVKFAKGLMKEVGFKLVTADLKWTNWGIVRKDVDAWWSAGPHPVSVLCFLFKQISVDWVKKGNGWAKAAFNVDGGYAGTFISWSHPVKERTIELVGVKKTILIKDVEKKLWVIEHGNGDVKFSVPFVEYKLLPLKAALTEFVHCVKTGEESICGPKMIEQVTRLML